MKFVFVSPKNIKKENLAKTENINQNLYKEIRMQQKSCKMDKDMKAK